MMLCGNFRYQQQHEQIAESKRSRFIDAPEYEGQADCCNSFSEVRRYFILRTRCCDVSTTSLWKIRRLSMCWDAGLQNGNTNEMT